MLSCMLLLKAYSIGVLSSETKMILCTKYVFWNKSLYSNTILAPVTEWLGTVCFSETQFTDL